MNKTPTTLIIMDGFGLRRETAGNAIAAANTPRLDQFFQEYAHTELSASGLDVGLPAGQMGNSEVGHTNIGAGRVVFQDLPRISKSIEDGDFFENPAYLDAMRACRENGSALHLMGLLSDGGVHSHIDHLFALMKMAKEQGLDRLTQQGLVHKVTTEEGALYQYCPQAGCRHDCFLLRCERCGRMVHLDCAHLEEVCRHLSAEHRFYIDPRRTVLTGLCAACEEAEHER